ncbi:cytochrome c biogenesis protein CcsA [Wenzhouxiangella sp. AB-CW3]|uniref:cytochrome C assembly family protein n=1 Tax=Wenzhouxiangella sp. AB-CW3 TaxID=2771012 RepID=UPI00168BF2F0|nr:cytochrome c biogenesis protein CcsA [Wenzhouxiangella sp. AB-CW3]QOC23484.1 cytochrome c biogenesis protein CcsA [Wenzhouxiangella sp. AB-CW3]
MDNNALIFLLPIAVYLGAAIDLVMAELRDRHRFRHTGLILAALAVVLHAIAVAHAVGTAPGWDVNFINMLSLVALLIVATLLITSLPTRSFEAGIIALPGAALCVSLQWLAPAEPLILDALSTTTRLHIVSSLMAFSLLSIAAINAILLAAQDYALRHPPLVRRLEFLPPLAVIETIMFRLIVAGWALLTLGLISGMVFVDNLFAQHLVHKTTLSLLSWVLFGALLAGRHWLGWRGRRAVRWTLVAMFVLALGYFGSKLVLEVFLDRSWMISAGA